MPADSSFDDGNDFEWHQVSGGLTPEELPNFAEQKHEETGLWIYSSDSLEGRTWRTSTTTMYFGLGYAFGSYQKFWRLGNRNLARVFLRLAELEEKAWNKLQRMDWKPGKPFRHDTLLDLASKVLNAIVSCSVLADGHPDLFAVALSDAYENALQLEKMPMAEARKEGRRRDPAAREIVDWFRKYPQGEREYAIATLEKQKKIRIGSTRQNFWILDDEGKRTSRSWKVGTLNAWWTASRKNNSEV